MPSACDRKYPGALVTPKPKHGRVLPRTVDYFYSSPFGFP
jgi:hypothetical protein